MNLPEDTSLPRELWPESLLNAYASACFPMEQDGEILWFRPVRRGLLPLDERFHISRSLRRTIRRGRYVCTVNRAFADVMQCCRENRDDGEWIGPQILKAFHWLHELGFAHSVEAWPAGQVGQGRPVGGLYGVALGGGFFAESMFHRRTDAGKVAVVELVHRLARRGFAFCDIQWITPHLATFGAYEVSARRYETLLAEAMGREVAFWDNAETDNA